MKHLLLPLLAAIALPTTVNANVSLEVHNICRDVSDYLGCVKANQVEDSLKSKNEEVILYKNPFNSSQSCLDEAIDRDLDPYEVCPNCVGMTESSIEALNNGECVGTEEHTTWFLKKIGCGLLGIAVMDPKMMGNSVNFAEVKTCWD